MNEKYLPVLEKINFILIQGLIFLLPLFFLPITDNFYEMAKQAFLITGVGLLGMLWITKNFLAKELVVKSRPLDIPVLAIALSYLLATFFKSPNRVESFLMPSQAGTILALTAFYFLLVNNLKKEQIRRLIWLFFTAGSLVSVLIILQLFLTNIGSIQIKALSPTGGLLPTIAFFAVLLPLLIKEVVESKAKNIKILSLSLVPSLLIAAGLVISFSSFFTTKPILLPQMVGWQIAIDAIKTSPLFGVGPANFLAAFTQFKPLSFNQTPIWGNWFNSSSNYYFHLMTTVGLLGLASFLFLAFQLITSKAKKTTLFLPLVLILITLAIFPVNFLSLFLLYFILALTAIEVGGQEQSLKSPSLFWGITIPVFLILALGLFFNTRTYLAEIYFKQSFDAINSNKGVDAYYLQIKAISLNPYRTDFRTAYSQTNFALANALAQKKDLNDQDRQNISTLIQQAIREAKSAVYLNQGNVSTWENMARIYRSLINFAQGADTWTLNSYQQTILLDPYNPNLRLSLGGVYYSLQKWDEAIQYFNQAVTLKPDFANGYYNLSAAYRNKGDLENAVKSMEQVVKLTAADSDDSKKANDELEKLKKQAAEKPKIGENKTSGTKVEQKAEANSSGEALKPPQSLPTGINPPISLPTGSAPETKITPTVTP